MRDARLRFERGRAAARMTTATLALPYATDLEGLGDDPMRYLRRWREALGDLYALPIDGPLLSRSPDCSGVVAAFGETHQRAVLSDIERFVLPESAAVRLDLPSALRNLNAGLHGMRGLEHERQKQWLGRALFAAQPERVRAIVSAAVEPACAALHDGGPLLNIMRGLTLRAGSRLLFGDAAAQTLPATLMAYFQMRRELSAPGRRPAEAERRRLIELGAAVDAGLRAYRAAVRAGRGSDDAGVLASLAVAPSAEISEDAFVAHANVLFVSSNEPVAIALAWTLLVLSQLPGLRARLREEVLRARIDGGAINGAEINGTETNGTETGGISDGRPSAATPLLDAVLDESLRVLTPNALMVRVTREPVRLGDRQLPGGCEILICPFLSHRDPRLFSSPQRFLPGRWRGQRPSPYVYFPFGAGGHVCIGRALALRLLRETLAALLARGEIVLDGDATVDWRVHVLLAPIGDPRVRLREAAQDTRDGRLLGGVRDIVELSDEWC